ncbi:MAG: type IV pilus inner membrane component PilO [Thermoleophilia bacterium]
MKKRDIGILIGLVVVVLLVAWYFLLISPKRDENATLQSNISSENAKLQDNKKKLATIDQQRKAAQQTEGDLIKLDKLIPTDSQLPSLMIELQQTATDAGVSFMDIKPGAPVAGTPGATIIPLSLKIEGGFFDVNDFLYRVENYARMEGSDVNVSGRLINVVTFKIGEPDVSGFKFPSVSSTGQVTPGHIMLSMDINVFMTTPPTTARPGAAAPGSSGSAGAATTPGSASGAGASGGR